jgi:hypothetical protein
MCRFIAVGCQKRRRSRLRCLTGSAMKLTAFSALTFDCYGTLIDWESGIVTGLAGLAKRTRVTFSRNQLLEARSGIPTAGSPAERNYRKRESTLEFASKKSSFESARLNATCIRSTRGISSLSRPLRDTARSPQPLMSWLGRNRRCRSKLPRSSDASGFGCWTGDRSDPPKRGKYCYRRNSPCAHRPQLRCSSCPPSKRDGLASCDLAPLHRLLWAWCRVPWQAFVERIPMSK